MLDKDPTFQEFAKGLLPYISTVFLSCWGGFVSYIQKVQIKTRRFSLKDLMFDLVISSFAGLLTHFFCTYAKIDDTIAAILIAISGHMGARAIISFERMRDRMFGIDESRRDYDAKN
mgnify:CR=1 FL=1